MMIDQKLQTDIAIPPSEYLAEVLEEFGMSQADLARRAGRPVQVINEIIKGTKAITAETAVQFEQVLGVPAYIWLNLDREYQLTKARLHELKHLKQESTLLPEFPYKELAKCGLVKQVRDNIEKTRELLRFFGVASFATLANIHTAAFRKAQRVTASPYALAAWLRWGELQAATIETEPFNTTALRAVIENIRALTCEVPEEFQPKLTQQLARCGVAFVLVPHLPKTYAHGATFWVQSAKAVVQMSTRGKYSDIFWFSLFHEIGHVLLHGKRDVFIEEPDAVKDAKEIEADTFARDTLIPSGAYRLFIERKEFSTQAVRQFAKQIGIAPGIVVGRLQHDGYLPRSHLNSLREQYEVLHVEPCP
jgi:HTH-type transcriptional regulator/antitoxin HigA